jgi:UDP-N-acetylmuramyl pentapeptide phosphotransferase/UDP-N-acetylglucosamine-1-phosphate transferase
VVGAAVVWISPLVFVALSFFVALALTRWLVRDRSRFTVVDVPNERSLHRTPVPRTGGVAIVLALALAFAGLWTTQTLPVAVLLGPATLIAVISFFDDRRSIPVATRLGAHLIAASTAVFLGFRLPEVLWPGVVSEMPSALASFLSVLFIVWMTNLYNFMDGMDGLAGGMAVFGFGGLATLGAMHGHAPFAAANACVAASALGFLVFNFPPAKIFMGDTGSSTLGFLAAVFGLWGAREGVAPLWATVLLFSPFIVDATVTLARRLGNGERVWHAHRTHFYQRLVQSGLGHRKTVLGEYALMFFCLAGVLTAVMLPEPVQRAVLGVSAGVYGWLIFWANRHERRSRQTVNGR